jgi:hypothetical protein
MIKLHNLQKTDRAEKSSDVLDDFRTLKGFKLFLTKFNAEITLKVLNHGERVRIIDNIEI